MKNLISFFLILATLSFGCKKNSNNISELQTVNDTINIKEINILTSFKNNNYPSSLKDSTICNKWMLSKEDIKKVITLSKKINNSQWDYAYDHLPCQYSGKLKFKNNEYDFNLNSGAWLEINYKNSIIRYGYEMNDYEKYFLSSPLDND